MRAQGLPIQCSVFLTRREGLLQSTNSSNADYLFQPDKLHADMVRRAPRPYAGPNPHPDHVVHIPAPLVDETCTQPPFGSTLCSHYPAVVLL